jgi:hypothetical protein
MFNRCITTGRFIGLMLCVAAVFLVACKDDPEPAPSMVPTTVAQQADPHPSSLSTPSVLTPWETGQTPKGVLAVFGVSSVRTLLQELTVLGKEVAPGELPPDMASEVSEGLRDGFGFTDVGWLRRDAPVRVVVMDPVDYPGVALLVLPMTTLSEVQKNYGANARVGEAGHAAVWEHRGEPVCVDYLPGHVVVSRDLVSYGVLRSFLADEVLKWTPKATVTLALESRRIQEVFSEELADLKAGLENEDVVASIAPYAEFGLWVLEHTEQVVVGLGVRAGNLESTVAIRGERGSDVGLIRQALMARRAPLRTALPEASWLVISSDVDLRSLRVVDALERLYFERLGLSDKVTRAQRARAYALFERVRSLDTGPMAFGMYQEGAFPFAALLTVEVKDREAISKVSDDLLRLAFLSLRDVAQKTLAVAEIEVSLEDVDSLEAFIPLLNDVASPLGIETTWVEKRTDSLSLRGLRVDIDWTKTGLEEVDAAFYETLKETLGERIELAQAVNGEHVALAFGPSALQSARDALERARLTNATHMPAGRVAEALSVRLRAGGLWRAFNFLPFIQQQGELDLEGPDEVMWMGLGASDGGLVGSIRLPMSLLKALVGLTL